MTPREFAAALERWGADMARWPEAERAAAVCLLDRSAEARTRLREAARLEGFIRANDPAGGLDAAALARVERCVRARLPASAPRRGGPGWPEVGRRWLPRFAVSIATAAALGLIIGDLLPVYADRPGSPIEALVLLNAYLPLDM